MLTIAATNAYQGGFSSYQASEPWPVRWEALTAAIQTINADIHVLSDTYRWRGLISPQRLCRETNYDQACLIDLYDPGSEPPGSSVDRHIGLTVLTRGINATFQTVRLGTRNAVQVDFTNRGIPMSVIGLYLDHRSSTHRRAQASALVSHCATLTQPLIVAGDFNEPRPADIMQRHRLLGRLLQWPVVQRLNPRLLGQLAELLKVQSVTPLLQRAGFRDAAPAKRRHGTFHGTGLARILTTAIPLPIDQIWSRNCDLTNWQVWRGPAMAAASDHWPVSAGLA